MRRLSREPWFHDKAIGWGLSPAGWQGWAATAVFVVVFASTLSRLRHGSIGLIVGLGVVEVVAFCGLAYLTSTHAQPGGQ
jgi:hypothetical protein